jgi:RNA polymerase sigma-70 factor (ECF subfamily)
MLQNVFMKLWQNRSNLNPNKSIKHYLYRTACNLTIDHARTNSREVHLSPDSDVVDRKVPDQVLEIKEKIYIILNSMPKDVQQVFILSRIEGMKYHEIAQLFDISVKTVEKRMGKAIKILSQHHSI